MAKTIFSHFEPHIENGRIKNLKKLLNDTGAMPATKDVFAEFGKDADSVIAYIIMMYCNDSSYFFAGQDYYEQKLHIAKLTGLNLEKHQTVINLTSESVIKAVNFFADELKNWKRKKVISLREAAQRLDNASKNPMLLAANKNPAKLIRDAEVFGIELSEKADKLEKEIQQTTKSTERTEELERIEIKDEDYEEILLRVTKG